MEIINPQNVTINNGRIRVEKVFLEDDKGRVLLRNAEFIPVLGGMEFTAEALLKTSGSRSIKRICNIGVE